MREQVEQGAVVPDAFSDLAAEEEALDAVLTPLDAAGWAAPSAAPGWSVADVVLHLAQSEEAVVASVAGKASPLRGNDDSTPLDDVMARRVTAERGGSHDAVLQRWRSARACALDALRSSPAQARLEWAAARLTPATLATTRLAEHWVHALDITAGLGLAYPDTMRLQRIAWLAHRSLPYAFGVAGEEQVQVQCELTGPDGVTVWRFGPDDAEAVIRGDAGAFCRVAAQRLRAEESGLSTSGDRAVLALSVLRTYAI